GAVAQVEDADPERILAAPRRTGDDKLSVGVQRAQVLPVRVQHLELILDAVAGGPKDDEEAYDGNTTSARDPVRSKLPCSSSRTSARTIERPVPVGAPPAPFPSSAIASTTSPLRRASSMRTAPA